MASSAYELSQGKWSDIEQMNNFFHSYSFQQIFNWKSCEKKIPVFLKVVQLEVLK